MEEIYSFMTNIFLILFLLVCSALFSSCETAFSSVNKIRLKNEAAGGNKRAAKTLKIANSFDKALTAILIGNNIVNTASAALGTIIFTDMFGSSGVGIATSVMTVLVLIFGEILPKSFAKENAEKLASLFTPFLSVFIVVLTPLIWIFMKIKALVDLLYKKEKKPSVTEDELKCIIEEIEEEGVLEEQESDLVRSALEFDEITVDKILTPRVKVIGIDINSDIEKIKEVFITEMYSRLPVYEKNLDNIIGVITEKEFFKMVVTGGNDIKSIMQDAMYISDLKLISEAFREMQKEKNHLAIVVDQYGGTKGIITLEDIIEELVGEIYDENDEIENPVIKISENVYDISCDMNISDMLEKIGLPENTINSEYNSVSGWVNEIFGNIPQVTEETDYKNLNVKVTSRDEQVVHTIRLTVNQPSEESED